MKYETKFVPPVHSNGRPNHVEIERLGHDGWEVKASAKGVDNTWVILQRVIPEICKDCQRDERYHDPSTGKCFYGPGKLDLP